MGSAGHKYFNPKPEKISPNVRHLKKILLELPLRASHLEMPATYPEHGQAFFMMFFITL